MLESCEEFIMKIRLEKGKGRGFAIGCDLSYDYVRLNSEYTT